MEDKYYGLCESCTNAVMFNGMIECGDGLFNGTCQKYAPLELKGKRGKK
jgi:hypothetical protein